MEWRRLGHRGVFGGPGAFRGTHSECAHLRKTQAASAIQELQPCTGETSCSSVYTRRHSHEEGSISQQWMTFLLDYKLRRAALTFSPLSSSDRRVQTPTPYAPSSHTSLLVVLLRQTWHPRYWLISYFFQPFIPGKWRPLVAWCVLVML